MLCDQWIYILENLNVFLSYYLKEVIQVEYRIPIPKSWDLMVKGLQVEVRCTAIKMYLCAHVLLM